jgi:hypothetical protein
VLLSAIHLAPVANPDHHDDQAVLADLVDDAIHSGGADAVAVDLPTEFLAARRPRIVSERVDDGHDLRAGGCPGAC